MPTAKLPELSETSRGEDYPPSATLGVTSAVRLRDLWNAPTGRPGRLAFYSAVALPAVYITSTQAWKHNRGFRN